MSSRTFIWKISLALALLAPAAAHARPPMSREWRGSLTALDAAYGTLTITHAQHGPLELRWTESTRFVAGTVFTTAEAMRRGAAVEVRYRSAFLGEP